jgi:hypothetical protein
MRTKNPLLSLLRWAAAFECSVLNQDILFDLELLLVWKGLTGHSACGCIGYRDDMAGYPNESSLLFMWNRYN